MSEGSKMGLFGSKDDKKDLTSDDTTKQQSPNRSAPYCIDSDSETYDTEALSIMDINDIIGVQTEQAIESTLESEIAALSEIITDSKGETSSAAMNEVSEESSDIKFTEELLTEFTSLSPVPSSVSTIDAKILDETLTTDMSETKNINLKASNELNSESSTFMITNEKNPSCEGLLEVDSNVKIDDKNAPEATNIVLTSDVENNKSIEAKNEFRTENEAKEETLVSFVGAVVKNLDSDEQRDKISVAEKDIVTENFSTKTDNVVEDKNSETEIVSCIVSEVATHSLEVTSEVAEMSLDDEKIINNENSLKSKEVAVISVDNIVDNDIKAVKDVEFITELKLEEEIAVDDSKDEKLIDILTNIGSTSKSLQLIGEAYISEDSQETDEKDESPIVKVASVILNRNEKQKIIETEPKFEQKVSSDEVSMETPIDDSKAIVIADIPKSPIKKFNLDNQADALLGDKQEPDNTKEISLDLENNSKCDDQDLNVGSQIDMNRSKDQDKTNEASQPIEVTSVQIKENNVIDADSKTEISLTKELFETKEESMQEIEQLENIFSNVETKTNKVFVKDEGLMLEKNCSSEELQEKTSGEVKLFDEVLEFTETNAKVTEINTEPVFLAAKSHSNEETMPIKQSNIIPSIESIETETESKDLTEENSELQIKNVKDKELIKYSEPVLSIETQTVHSKSSQSSLEHLSIEDKFAEQISAPSTSSSEMNIELENKDDQDTAAITCARKIIPIEERYEKIPDNVEEKQKQLSDNVEKQQEKISDTVEEQQEQIPDNVEKQQEKISDTVEEQQEQIPDNVEKQHEKVSDNVEEQQEQISDNVEEQHEKILDNVEEQHEKISDNVEKLPESVEENIEKRITVDAIKQEDVPLNEEVGDSKVYRNKDEEDREELASKSDLCNNDVLQEMPDKSTSQIITENDTASSNNMSINKSEESTKIIEEKIDETDNLITDAVCSASTSCVATNVNAVNIVGPNQLQENNSFESVSEVEKPSFSTTDIDSSKCDIARENLNVQKAGSTDIKNVDLAEGGLTEDQIGIESEFKEVASENATSPDTGPSNLETIESNLSKTTVNQQETVDNTAESSEISETEKVNLETVAKYEMSKIDDNDTLQTVTFDLVNQSEKHEPICDSLDDTENEAVKDTSDNSSTHIEGSKCFTETSDETIVDKTPTLAESEVALEDCTIHNPVGQEIGCAITPNCESDKNKLHMKTVQNESKDCEISSKQLEIDDRSELITKHNDMQSQISFNTNTESSANNLKFEPESEVSPNVIIEEEQNCSKIQVQKLQDEADSQVVSGEATCSVLCDELLSDSNKTETKINVDLPENSIKEISSLLTSVQESQEVENKSEISEDIVKSLESRNALGIDDLLSAKVIDDNNSPVTANIYSSVDDLELVEIASTENTVEDEFDGAVLNLSPEITPILMQSENLIETGVKIDEDMKCEPVEELEKLTEEPDEILIDELANSVLKESAQSLESLNNLEILPDGHLSASPIISSDQIEVPAVMEDFSEVKNPPISLLEEINETCFVDESNPMPSVSHTADYITDVIISSTNIENIQLPDSIEDMDAGNVTIDEFKQENQTELVQPSENLVLKDSTAIDSDATNINEACKLEIEGNLDLEKDIGIDSSLKQEDEKLIECAVLKACDVKMDLPDEVLFDTEDAEQNDVLCSAQADNIDTSQQSSEISELECAVKFLQESEEQTIDSPLLLSPKIAEDIVEDNSEQNKSCLFLPETEVCQDTLELPVELEEITPNPITISEAEIISEAAKLEHERKLKIAAELIKTSEHVTKPDIVENRASENDSGLLKSLLTGSDVFSWQQKSETNAALTSEVIENTQIPNLSGTIRKSEKIPKISILEERLKEPPKIEIPIPELSSRILDTPTTPKTSLLIQRDSRIDTKTMYQKMLDSPKGSERSEPRIGDTPRKDSDKHDFENVGSPRIILKIAKSAITDCGEPRSPKSPKIRSAANSPNPEDSPGQKLGKIKLKLSKGGHPSIISNDNFDEGAQRHMEAILSPSHIGMKIKLSKTGDASIIQPDKHDSDEIKEGKHKFDEAPPKRIESPLGMKIKLSKTGDPSIVQQESKESKRKDKLDVGQEIPKRTDSPIGMKIKLSKSGDASIIPPEKQETSEDSVYKEKFEIQSEIPKRTDSPIGMKIKLSKTGETSIISSENYDEFKDVSSKSRDKLTTNQEVPKRTDSPLGMKFKLSKSGEASIIQPEKFESLEEFKDRSENIADVTKRVESPIGMKIKLSKTGDASIIHPEKQESDEHKESITMRNREKSESREIQKRTDSPIGMRIKVTKSGEASVIPLELPQDSQESLSLNTEGFEVTHEIPKRNESPIGMKIKLSKTGDASIIHPEKAEYSDECKESCSSSRGNPTSSQEGSKSSESSLGMKIKLSKTGDASIIYPGSSLESKDSQLKQIEKLQSSQESLKRTEFPLGMKIKLSKSGDASIIETDKKEKPGIKQKEKLANSQESSHKRKETEFPIEMKIKLSKTGHPTIIANEKQDSLTETHSSKNKDHFEGSQSTHQKSMEPTSPVKDPHLRIFNTGHSTIIQSNRSEVTIEPIQMSSQQPENAVDISSKSNDVTISPIDVKKSKFEDKLSHMLPEVTIQPVMSGEQNQIVLDKKSNTISRQQMSVINQEISITQVSPSKPPDLSMSGKLKEMLRKNATNSPANSDCEIIEHRPELIIVNENSNSSQDVMIIEEVKAPPQEVKIPRKRGRPKRSSLPPGQPLIRQALTQDPLTLYGMQQTAAAEHRESDRPKRTCRNQKSYAPPKRGRGRGRGKRKMDRTDCGIGKIPRLEDSLTEIERSTMSLIPLQSRIAPEETAQTSELYKALKQSPADRKRLISDPAIKQGIPDTHKKLRLETESEKQLASVLPSEQKIEGHVITASNAATSDSKSVMIPEMLQLSEPSTTKRSPEKLIAEPKPDIQESKNIIPDMTTTEHQNWLTPSIKLPESISKTEAISMVQVMDEETRMSAESNSRSQTPARNISVPAAETVVNEESQGSVLSTATTESEKVKVKNRRMEINFDPDEGPFTVDKIAEYEWPFDKKGDTFMIQEQISQYLGVKSFKRKYPDLKRRMVEMEERNYLRENGLVSEAMCDMGLTAICSSEVLDVMCSDFPDQYEEYRKHMREKQAKEHSKKQKELTAAANAERNRIDLAEMAVQSALSWNVNFNKARKESRKYSLDLQSFTIHVPKKQQKVDPERKVSNYPVALIPGQYTDYYREYTPAELRYYPLNTVLYGPMRPNERKFDSQSEGSQSDSDSDSSSDDSSSSSSEGTQDTEESQSTVDEVEIEMGAHKEDNKNLKCKMCLKHLNKHGKAEVLIQCGTCNGNVHPSCIDLTLDMVPHIQGYSWQCTDCKTCVQCHNPADEDKMLFCDMCDRGYHIYCVGLRRVPQGRWHCRECAICASCGLRQPGGANSDRNSVAQWQHEYKKGERNTRVYVSTLCVPCSKLWRKGRYCPHCSRCHSAQRLDLEPNLVHCGACDKYLHLGCVELRYGSIDKKNYICECCSTPNQQHSRSLITKNFKT